MSFFTVSSSPISPPARQPAEMLDVIIVIPAGVVSVWMIRVKSLWTILLGIVLLS